MVAVFGVSVNQKLVGADHETACALLLCSYSILTGSIDARP
jgi:hypothetical protein